MRFLYEYRTSDNAKHSGEIVAPNREAAYAQLKEKGVKPSRLVEAPGFFNKLFGKGKRWIAIGVLGTLCLVFGLAIYAPSLAPLPTTLVPRPAPLASLPRHQIANIPANWTLSVNAIFSDDLDRMLAIYALPGVKVLPQTVGEVPASGEWVDALRRVVAGMRDEAKGFLALGKSPEDLARFLDERQRMEADYREQLIRKLRSNLVTKDEANASLSAMGLELIK